MKKKYIKLTRKQIKTINDSWKEMSQMKDSFCDNLNKLEQKMQKDTGIKDIEFFWCDNAIVGVGNFSKTMKLMQETAKGKLKCTN